jgi:hypothetical protein
LQVFLRLGQLVPRQSGETPTELYERHLESFVLEDAGVHYRRLAAAWLSDLPCAEYLARVRRRRCPTAVLRLGCLTPLVPVCVRCVHRLSGRSRPNNTATTCLSRLAARW